MFGNGIGSLRVIIFDVNTDEDKVIWQISGEAGNAWYQGQVPIASPSPFKVPPNSVELPSFKVQSRRAGHGVTAASRISFISAEMRKILCNGEW